MTDLKMSNQLVGMKVKSKFEQTKKHLTQLGVGVFVIMIGIAMLAWPAGSSNLIFSFTGVFFIATGIQLSLWALGVRSEFLGTNYDNRSVFELEEKPSLGVSEDIERLANLVEYLTTEIGVSYQIRRGLNDNAKRIESITNEAIALANNTAPQLSIVFLVAQLEEQFEKYKYGRSRNNTDRSSMSYVDEEKMISVFNEAYKCLGRIRNNVVHGRVPISQADIISIVDSGTRLVKALDDIDSIKYHY